MVRVLDPVRGVASKREPTHTRRELEFASGLRTRVGRAPTWFVQVHARRGDIGRVEHLFSVPGFSLAPWCLSGYLIP